MTKRIAGFLALAAFIFCGAVQAQQPDAARQHFAAGFTLLKNGDKAAAIAAFWRGLSLAPTNAQGHYYVGVTLFSMDPGDYPAMQDYLDGVQEYKHEDSKVSAYVLYKLGAYHLRRAVDIGGAKELADAESRLVKVEALYRFLRNYHLAARVPHYLNETATDNATFFYCAKTVVMKVQLAGRANPFVVGLYSDNTEAINTIATAYDSEANDWSDDTLLRNAVSYGYRHSFPFSGGSDPEISGSKVVLPAEAITGDRTSTMQFNTDASARVELLNRGRVMLSGTVVPCLPELVVEKVGGKPVL